MSDTAPEAPPMEIEVLSTGCGPLDEITGIGGLPRGRVVEIFGPVGGGKTTLAAQMIAAVRRAGGTAALVDLDHTLDPDIADGADGLLVAQPSTGQEALAITEALVRAGGVDLIVVDSVGELVDDAGEDVTARTMSLALRTLTGLLMKSRAVVVFLNPVRPRVGVTFGNVEVTYGGNALKFYASLRVEIRRNDTGNRIRVVKNKLSPPFRDAQVVLGMRGFIAGGHGDHVPATEPDGKVGLAPRGSE